MFRQKQITWVLWRGTNLSKHDTGQERPLTVIMMCRLVLDGGPWWPHQEGALKPLYHDSTLMDVQVAEGQGRWRLESWRRGEDEGWYEVHWGLYTIVNTYKCCMLALSTEPGVTLACTKKLSFGQAISEAEWRPLWVEFWKAVSCDDLFPIWNGLSITEPLQSNLWYQNICLSKLDV